MFLQFLNQLLFPVQCASCRAPNFQLCDICARAWSGPMHVGQIDRIPLIWSAHYSPITSPIILAAKENNHFRSQLILAQALDRGLSEARSRKLLNSEQKIYLVPVPSTKQSTRRRGHFHLRTVIGEMKNEVIFTNLLEITRKVDDQSTLTRRERAANIHGSYQVKSEFALNIHKLAEMRQGTLIIYDDLVTSGSSVREAVRALKVAKISPDFALSACAVGAL